MELFIWNIYICSKFIVPFSIMKNKYKEKTHVRDLRDAYGLTQEAMALLMGKSRSHMAKMELNDRTWTVDVTKLIAMETSLLPPMPPDLEAEIDRANTKQMDEWKQGNKKEIAYTKSRINGYQQKLEKLKTKEQQAVMGLRLAKKMLEAGPGPLPENESTVWRSLQALSWVKLSENGPAAQAALQEKIDELEAWVKKWEGAG